MAPYLKCWHLPNLNEHSVSHVVQGQLQTGMNYQSYREDGNGNVGLENPYENPIHLEGRRQVAGVGGLPRGTQSTSQTRACKWGVALAGDSISSPKGKEYWEKNTSMKN